MKEGCFSNSLKEGNQSLIPKGSARGRRLALRFGKNGGVLKRDRRLLTIDKGYRKKKGHNPHKLLGMDLPNKNQIPPRNH